ncbi:S8 family serine peptidase [Streptomyces sp. NBC_01433]|uniref:S8 family serine peptidase n=1 Tax=Streptomyces sp. NBC_01433 TaxID=2903864 RepID=UPI00224CE06C|nr:S8 family serine peptidase [Streptomyces sp. NBC_01433]MCX4678602.1 S8 family serine peptidase [Streptomyces sp. NBC_01433]
MRSSRSSVSRALGPAALAALLLIPGTAAPAGAAEGADSPTLPGMPVTLADGRPCTPGSAKRSAQVPWAQSFLGIDQAWELSRGAGVKVALIGTGADPRRVPALKGRVTGGPDVVAGGTVRDDCVGYGTFLAGIVAGGRQPGLKAAGVAPEAEVIAVRATDRYGATTPAALAKAIRAATASKARIVHVALSVPSAPKELKAAVRAAQEAGALVVAPASAREWESGAGAPDAVNGPAYPAALPGVLAVSSVGPGGVPEANGTVKGRRAQPRLSAPGVAVMGPGPGGRGQFVGRGDAVAGAFVAGTAALVLSYHPRLTADQVAHRLESTAYGAVGDAPDADLGLGIVDPVRALSAVLPEELARPPAGPESASAPAVSPLDPPHMRDSALTVAGSATGLVLLVAFLAVVLPRGRRRGWRAGRAPGPAAEAD